MQDLAEEERAALSEWQIGCIVSAVVPATGTVNRTLLVQAERGAFVLRVSARGRERAEWEHECIAFAATQGVPVCRPIPISGGTILERGGQFFALFPLASGQQIARAELRAEHARASGECLAHIHAALERLPTGRVRIKDLTGDIAGAVALIPHLDAAIHALPTQTATEQAAREQLAGRRAYLEQNGSLAESIPARLAALPQRVLHGDFQETNLFFKNAKVSAVIDWDQSGRAARGWEIVRALHLMFQLAPENCHAFLDGYESIMPLERGELEESAACYGLLSDSNLWVYAAVYLEGNARAKPFISLTPFVPFETQWKASGMGRQ